MTDELRKAQSEIDDLRAALAREMEIADMRAGECMTADELRKVEARYQRAFRRSEEARAARNAAVHAALAAGWTHARISEATGLSRGRIGQIAEIR